MPMMLMLMPTMLKGKNNDATMPHKAKPTAAKKPATKKPTGKSKADVDAPPRRQALHDL